MNMLRLPDVIKKTGLSRSSVYRYESHGNFPKSIKLGQRTVAWSESEIEDWLRKKLEARNIQE